MSYPSSNMALLRGHALAWRGSPSFSDVQDDCFEAELRTIIDVVEGRASQDAILSPYADAVETYKIASHHISL